jgi:predicted component of type VI protein secretion system
MNIVQNSDITVRLTITDGTNPYAISSLDDYEIYLYTLSGKDKVLVANYKKSNAGKYGITVYDPITGKVDIVIHRQDTKDIEGKLYAEVRIRLTATSDYVSSVQNLGQTGIEVTTVLKSAAPNYLP